MPLPKMPRIQQQQGISFQDCGGGSEPSWAQRAKEPLVPAGGAGSSAQQDIEVGGRGGSTPTGGAPQQQAQLQEPTGAATQEDINNIHRTVHEVAEIFQDLALLVDEQGTHIDHIQTNIQSAHREVDKGMQQLARASSSQKQARARMCFCAAFLIALLVVGILILHFGLHAF